MFPTPLGIPPPRWGARRWPERSGGPRRDPSLQEPHPPLFYFFFQKKIENDIVIPRLPGRGARFF
jgi:hypothetical protein